MPWVTGGCRSKTPCLRDRRLWRCRAAAAILSCRAGPCGAQSASPLDLPIRRFLILHTVAGVLLVLWLLGLVTSFTAGGLLHVMLVVAVVIVLLHLISGRRVGSHEGSRHVRCACRNTPRAGYGLTRRVNCDSAWRVDPPHADRTWSSANPQGSMNKVLALLVAGIFASGAFAQAPVTPAVAKAEVQAEANNTKAMASEAKVAGKADAGVAKVEAKADAAKADAHADAAKSKMKAHAKVAKAHPADKTSAEASADKAVAKADAKDANQAVKSDAKVAKAKIEAGADKADAKTHTALVKAEGKADVKTSTTK